MTTVDAGVADVRPVGGEASEEAGIPEVVSPAPRAAWDELLRSDPDALPTQSPVWLDAVCAVTGARDASRLYEFPGGRRLVVPLVRRRRGPLAEEASYPHAWGFGGLVGSAPRVDELRAILRDLRGSGALRVRLRPNPLHHSVWAAARPAGMLAIERTAHVLDLREGFDVIWRECFSKNTRTDVRRAERQGVRVEVDETGRLLPVYHQLVACSVERWARRQHEPLTLARWRAARRDSEEKLARIMRDLGSASRLWVAWVGQRPAAAILVLHGANAHDTRGVMDIEVAGPARANQLIQSLAIEDACRAGCASYHMGETGRSRSLARYKEGFGARPHEYAEYVAEGLPLTRIDHGMRTVVKRVLRFRDVA